VLAILVKIQATVPDFYHPFQAVCSIQQPLLNARVSAPCECSGPYPFSPFTSPEIFPDSSLHLVKVCLHYVVHAPESIFRFSFFQLVAPPHPFSGSLLTLTQKSHPQSRFPLATVIKGYFPPPFSLILLTSSSKGVLSLSSFLPCIGRVFLLLFFYFPGTRHLTALFGVPTPNVEMTYRRSQHVFLHKCDSHDTNFHPIVPFLRIAG